MPVTRDHSLKVCRQFPAFLIFLWQSICRVVRELKSCRWVTLPSQLGGRYCMKKKKKKRKRKKKEKNWQTFLLFIWPISQNFVHFTYATSLFQEGKFVKIISRVLVFLTSRNRAPLASSLRLNVSWYEINPSIIISSDHSAKAFGNRVELK